MSNALTDLVGYKFDSTQKSWKAAFLIGTMALAGQSVEAKGHYELLGAADIAVREKLAVEAGNLDAAHEYGTAAKAIAETQQGLRATPNDLPSDFKAKLFSENGGELFKVIDPVADVDWTEFEIATKTARVKAELVPEGTRVETIMASGLVETAKTAGAGGGYKVTALTGEQYLVDKAKFEKLYNETDVAGVFEPKPDPRKVMGLEQNVAFTAPWGEEMRIRANGVLVHGGMKDVYGIQPDEFRASYTIG